MRLRSIVLGVLGVLVAGCGQLDNPDVGHGAVTGRIPNASTGAYAYLLGRPDLKVQAAPDGTFRLDGVGVGNATVVLFDGSTRAESVAVEVEGARIHHVGEFGRPLKLAAALDVAASPLAGTRPTGLVFSVAGTPIEENGESGAARLFPLPAGSFSVMARQPGFEDERIDVSVTEGAESALEVGRQVDVEDDRRGCLSCGCDKGLKCNSTDGRCYECVVDLDCGSDGTCTSAHVCSRPPGAGLLCDACSVASDCLGTGATCVNPALGQLTGYCSTSCAGTQDCRSGDDCRSNQCTAPSSCLATTATYGSACTGDSTCASALKDGKCFPFDRPQGTPGYCSARIQAGCPAGFGADPRGTGYCARLP